MCIQTRHFFGSRLRARPGYTHHTPHTHHLGTQELEEGCKRFKGLEAVDLLNDSSATMKLSDEGNQARIASEILDSKKTYGVGKLDEGEVTELSFTVTPEPEDPADPPAS